MTPPSAVEVRDDAQLVASDLLGPLTIPRAELLQFPDGLYGFPECRSYALVPTAREGLFWLQSVEHAALAFLLVDPFVHFPGYAVDLSPVELARVGTSEPSDLVVLAIVTMGSRDGTPCTANLQGPVILNMRSREGFQVVLSAEGYGVREPFAIDAGESAAV